MPREPDNRDDGDIPGKPAGMLCTDSEAVALMISNALRRAYMVVMDDLNRTIHGAHIRPLHYAIMRVVGREPGVQSSQLTNELRIKRTNLVPLLDQVEALNLVERRSIPRNRRARALYLTQTGHSLMAQLLPMVAAHERRLAARLGVDGKKVLIDLLSRMADPDFDLPPT